MSAKKIVSFLLALVLLSGLALADSVVGESGDSWVRSGPGRGYTKLTTLEEGESCEFLGSTSTDERGVVWYRVRCDDVDGWVSSRYTVLVGSTSDWSDGWGDDDGYWEGGDTRYVRATGGVVNVRSGPGLGYDDKGTLLSGSTATYLNEYSVDERGVTWYKISYNGGSGWVSSRYCTLH